MQNEQYYIIVKFNELDKLPKPFQQRSVLLKNVVLNVTEIVTYTKTGWSKDAKTAGDYSAIYNFLKNRNNHTTSDWNCIRNQSHSNYIVNRLEKEEFKMSKKYCIKDSITDEYLIDHYGFEKEPWFDHYNLVTEEDKYGLGLHVWWANRHVSILLGEHAEGGIAPIPKLLVQLLKDDILEEKEVD